MSTNEILNSKKNKLYFEYLKEGKLEYRDKLIIGNYNLTKKVASIYAHGNELEELVSIGTIGLIRAVDSYEVGKKIEFSTYACICIRNEILMNLRHLKPTISIDETINNIDDNELKIVDTLKSDINLENTIVDKIYNIEMLNKIKKIIEQLDPKTQDILFTYFGIDREKKNQLEIAKKYNMSRAFVSKKIIDTLKLLNQLLSYEEIRVLTKTKKKNKIKM